MASPRKRKWLYVLPNLFTLSSVFCGLYAMTLVTRDTPAAFYGSALAILFGMLFDGLDGRVARLTRTQSSFGMQLDSLADVITFGAAPAFLIWKWALEPLGFIGLFLAFSYLACGALRLARFNVIEARGGSGGASSYFMGLPIPLAAGVLVSLVIAHTRTYGDAPIPALPVAVLVGLLAYLMVSTVRYRTFKQMRLTRRNTAVVAFVLTSAAVLTIQVRASFTLLVFASLYVFLGLLEEVIFFRRRREERLVARTAAAGGRSAVVDEDDDESDAE